MTRWSTVCTLAVLLGTTHAVDAQGTPDDEVVPAPPATEPTTAADRGAAPASSDDSVAPTAPDEDETAVSTPETITLEADVAPALPRRTPGAPPSASPPRRPAAYDSEVPTAPLPPPPDPDVELSIGLVPNVAFISGGLAPSIATETDILFEVGSRAWVGAGLSVSYAATRSEAFPGAPSVESTTTSVSVPITFQYYLDVPTVGSAIPTFRLGLDGSWSERPIGPMTPNFQRAGMGLAIRGGVTWLGVHWLALRILAGLRAGFDAAVVGPQSISFSVGVEALVAAVVRI